VVNIYADTSLLMAWHVPEPFSSVADAVIAEAGTILISDLVVSEMRIAIDRRRKSGHWHVDQASAVRRRFDEHITRGVSSRSRSTASASLRPSAFRRSSRHRCGPRMRCMSPAHGLHGCRSPLWTCGCGMRGANWDSAHSRFNGPGDRSFVAPYGTMGCLPNWYLNQTGFVPAIRRSFVEQLPVSAAV
jgi:uncharacterized protein with PIN domain